MIGWMAFLCRAQHSYAPEFDNDTQRPALYDIRLHLYDKAGQTVCRKIE